MSILGVRLELFVNDVERSARFYREVLGFRPAHDVDEAGYLPISSGALTIGLQGHANLLYGLAVTAAPALGAGIEPIGDRAWGLRDFRLIDPDGYYLCISSPQA